MKFEIQLQQYQEQLEFFVIQSQQNIKKNNKEKNLTQKFSHTTK